MLPGLVLFVAWAGAAEVRGPEACGSPTAACARVHSDGALLIPTNEVTSRLGLGGASRQIRLGFGLPGTPGERRWVDDESVPICQTAWEKDGIRYTQTVLVTSLETNDQALTGPAPSNAVLLVQVAGHNTTAEYSAAGAAFEVKSEDRALPLEWRGGLVFVTGARAAVPLAAIDVPSEGIAGTNGLQLRFAGSMPPGTSGAMTVKIPSRVLERPAEINRLLDLEFDEELRRVKRAWKSPGEAAARPFPVGWAEPLKPAALR
jgi:hypothetical protein